MDYSFTAKMARTFALFILLVPQIVNGVWVKEKELMELVQRADMDLVQRADMRAEKWPNRRAWSNTKIQNEIKALKSTIDTLTSQANALETDTNE